MTENKLINQKPIIMINYKEITNKNIEIYSFYFLCILNLGSFNLKVTSYIFDKQYCLEQEQSEKYNHSIIIYWIVTLKGDKKNKRVSKLVKTNAQIRTQIKVILFDTHIH